MRLDRFDIKVLDQSGNAQEILYEMYGKEIGENNAVKQLAGIRTHLNYKRSMSNDRPIGEMEETVFKADGSLVTKRDLILSETESQDPKFVMETMGFSPLQWKLNWCKTKRGYWDTSMKLRTRGANDEYGKPTYHETPVKKTNHTYKCEISISPIQDVLTEEMINNVFDKMSKKVPKLVQYKHKKKDGDLFELPIMDLHLGKLAWGKESGDNYDLHIASDLFRKSVQEALDSIKLYSLDIERIVFPLGQDFFHFDTTKSTTTKGTVMDTDIRWPKMYEEGVELAVWAIENLRAIAPVDVIYVAANHDKMLSFFLTKHVEAYFRNCRNVKVNASPYPRKYVTYGDCLIGYSHGADERKQIDVLMQQECPTWSQTKWREWHLGHLHKEMAREIGGVIIRNVASITSRDNWHTEHGYQATRKAQAFVWSRKLGKRLTIDINVMV